MSFIRNYAKRYKVDTHTGQERRAKKSFKQKILDAADRQLRELSRYSSEEELNYRAKGSNSRWWWSSRPLDGRRAIKIYVQGTLLEGDSTGVVVDNTLGAVREEIERIRAYIESTAEKDWEAEEQRRREAAERWKARDRERSLNRRKTLR